MTNEIELKDYKIEAEIARTPLLTTYRVHRHADEAVVALQVINPLLATDEQFQFRFREMAEQHSQLEHPNIIRVHEARQEGAWLYRVEELFEAPTLAQLLAEQGALAARPMIKIARQIAVALDYAHERGFIHGDLTADCVLIGANNHVIVTRFGQTQSMAGTSLAKQGYALGTPEVLAPERIHGQNPSATTDLYSLGVLSYQMLANEPPFTGTLPKVLHAQAYEQPRPLHLINPGISIHISQAIERMLSKRVESRYESGVKFVNALSHAMEGTLPSYIGATSGKSPTRKNLTGGSLAWPWRYVLVGGGLLLLLLTLGLSSGVGAVSLWQISHNGDAAAGRAGLTPSSTGEVAPPHVDVATETATVAPLKSVPTATHPIARPALPTPGEPTTASDSPFTNLQLARALTPDNQPEGVAVSFERGVAPLYLFFDYADIEPGTPWVHRWRWADTELAAYEAIWSADYDETGQAWVYFSPVGGYQSGPYQVNLEVAGQTVATATFVIMP